MMTYRNPQTKQTQEVGENESVRRSILEQLGWRAVVDGESTTAEKPAAVAKPTKTEEPQKLASHGQPAAKNVATKDEGKAK